MWDINTFCINLILLVTEKSNYIKHEVILYKCKKKKKFILLIKNTKKKKNLFY